MRRLSNTPIQDVARIAAEVAQSASSLDLGDEDEKYDKKEIQAQAYPSIVDSDDGGSGAITPAQDRVPLFSHECCSLPSEDEPEENYSAPQIQIQKENDDDIDINDPLLEAFPSDRDLVLERVRTLETSLDMDPTSFDGTPSSPVVSFNYKGERLSEMVSTPTSSVLRTPDMSPSLGSILEDGEENSDIPPLPSRGHSDEGNRKDSRRGSFKKQPVPVTIADLLTNKAVSQLPKNVDGLDGESSKRS